MAYNYLEPDNLADALSDSETYMRDFWQAIPELQRLTRGQPGKIPKGKPRVTDGTLAAIRRETPKQIIQQLPTGRVTIHKQPDMEDNANAILTDIILPNANSGGVPYSKAKRAIKSTVDVGSAWAHVFFNRTGTVLHADYKLKYYRDVMFEKGKVSEFDTNYMVLIDWLTEGDLKAVLWLEQQRKLTKTDYDLKAVQQLIDKGPSDKDEQAKDPAERKASRQNGYFKVVYFLQKGVDATFYMYSPTIKKNLRTWKTKDPRGVIPVHGLVAEDDDDNPYGEPLASISAGKQNLLDFDMQMYQYGQAISYSPPIKLWGNTPASNIKLVPDNVIEMNGVPATDDFASVDIGNRATVNFGNNYGLIKTQIQSEMGRRSDTSTSSAAGNPGFSKTSAGVQQGQAVTDISNNDLLVTYELWQGRIWETCLNIQFAESKGNKQMQFSNETLGRMKLDKQPTINYDQDYGKISFTVTANTAKKLSDAEQVANMAMADPLMTIQNVWQLGQIGWKLDIGEFQKAKFTRMNIDSVDKFLTKMDDKEAALAKQEPFPIVDPPVFRMNSADMTPEQLSGILARGGVMPAPPQPQDPNQPQQMPQPPSSIPPPPPGLSAQGQADYAVEMLKAQTDAMVKHAEMLAKTSSEETSENAASTQKPKTLGESIAWKPGDLTVSERSQALAQVGVEADSTGNDTPNAIQQETDSAVKLDKHVHDTALGLSEHVIKHTADIESKAEDKNEPKHEPANV